MPLIKLTVDNRESKFKEILSLKSTELFKDVEFANLLNGDFIIDVDQVPAIIIERKTINDLAGSIKDGRYKNQKIQLLSKYKRKNLYYIIEGVFGGFTNSDQSQSFGGMEKKTIIGAILNTMMRDDIKILFTKDLQETYDLVLNIYERISKDPMKYLETTEETNLQVNKNRTNTVFYNILCQIPGVSTKAAAVINKKYPTLSVFYDSLKECDDNQKLKVLKELKLESNTGTSRVISKTTLSNIVKHIFGQSDDAN